MTVKETNRVLMILQAAFPAFYRGLTPEEMREVRNLWQVMFEVEPYELVAGAVKALIATTVEGYPPTIGAVKEKIAKITNPQLLSEMDAWALVSKACQNGYYGYREEFAKLPPDVQEAVGSPEQLRIWSQMDETTLNSVVSSNFMRTFKAKQGRQKEAVMLPGEIKSMIAAMSERLQLSVNGEQKMLPAKEIPLEKLTRPVEKRVVVQETDEDFAKRKEEALKKLMGRK